MLFYGFSKYNKNAPKYKFHKKDLFCRIRKSDEEEVSETVMQRLEEVILEDKDGGSGTCTGTVKKFMECAAKFGFVSPDDGGDDVFINGGAESLSDGDLVRYDTLWNDRSQSMEAINCTVIFSDVEEERMVFRVSLKVQSRISKNT